MNRNIIKKVYRQSSSFNYQSSPQYKKDLEDGLKAEDLCKEKLESVFGTLNKTDRYCYYDFSNDKYIIELKSRNIKHNQFPTAMINLPKVEKWKKKDSNRDFICAFMYRDGLYYWKYNEAEIESVGKTGRTDRGCVESYDMVYFKNSLLIKI